MKSNRLALVSVVMFAVLALSSRAAAQAIAGLWDATVVTNGVEIPFRFEITGQGAATRGSFFNGDDRMTSTTGSFENGTLSLGFDELGTTLQATLKDGTLQGQYDRGGRGAPLPFEAKRFAPVPAGEGTVPAIAGLWNVQVQSAKGELAWQLIVRQSGAEASAAILRVDGDTGTLTGSFRDGKFVLSHFSGMRPLRLELTPQPDGSISLVQNKSAALTAVRAEEALAKGLPQPSDPSRFTSVKDPTEPLRFSFPDLTGKVVSNTDPRFQGKVVIVNIAGSWCPNCHDEVPFLVELYTKYKNRGLEVVALSFEEAAQMKNPVRLRAFMKRYGVEYTVLLPGEPKDLAEKLPQGVNLNSFPTSYFVGRDGRVRGAHTGFPGKASGKFYDEAREDITGIIERLLAEGPQPSR